MRLFGRINRKSLGITQANLRTILEDLEKVAPIDEEVTELLALAVMARLQEQNSAKWCLADEVGLDGDKLIDFMMMIIEIMIPLIVKVRPPIPVYTHSA